MCSEEGSAGALAAKDLEPVEELTKGKALEGSITKTELGNSIASSASKPCFEELVPARFAILSCTFGTDLDFGVEASAFARAELAAARLAFAMRLESTAQSSGTDYAWPFAVAD